MNKTILKSIVAAVLAVMTLILRKFRRSYLFSFVTAVLYGLVLDGLFASPKETPPAATLHKPRRVVERTSTAFFPTQTPWLSDALVYIRRHLGDGISATDVIARLGYSHTTVGKAFRDELGTSVQQEIIRQRRERACRLLKETSRTAADIAVECGYPSAQYFAPKFAEHFGITPDVWRRKT